MVHLGANHCVLSYNSAEPEYKLASGNDLNLHGYSSHNNLFEGNMGMDLASDGRADAGSNAYMGLYNVFFRNRLTGRMEVLDPTESGNYPAEHYTIVGNVADNTTQVGSGARDIYSGANRIGGSVTWGSLTSSASIPSSLYRTTKPDFFGSKPWPIFGPGVSSDWGETNTLPARDRAK